MSYFPFSGRNMDSFKTDPRNDTKPHEIIFRDTLCSFVDRFSNRFSNHTITIYFGFFPCSFRKNHLTGS